MREALEYLWIMTCIPLALAFLIGLPYLVMTLANPYIRVLLVLAWNAGWVLAWLHHKRRLM